MVKVNNKPTLNGLALRFLQVNRSRNFITVIAIILTTVMFTSLFTATFSVVKSKQQQEMRNTMDSSHISVQDLTKAQYDAVRRDGDIKSYGTTIFVATAENEALKRTQTEVRYADANGAAGFMCTPATGHLPQTKSEIALSTITLSQLNIEPRLGAKITLTMTTSGVTANHDFTLCGYWRGDPLYMAQMAWVSQDFALSRCHTATEEAIAAQDFEGDYNLSLWYSSPLGLPEKATALKKTYQLADTPANVGVNPAYDVFFGEDGFPLGTVALILAVIFVCGYLIIYNIFAISVNRDIKAYGRLKSIGATGRQLKAIVRRQALFLSVLGIPFGLLCGFFIGKAMTPYLLADVSATGAGETTVLSSANPLIFLFAAIFTLITVYIGCLRPCAILRRLSPIAAVNQGETAGQSNGEKQTGRVTPLAMAGSNLRRTWKKAVLVIISLTLPLMMLNAVYAVVRGFDFDAFSSVYIPADFSVSGNTNNLSSSDIHGVTPALREAIREKEEVTAAAFVYDTEFTFTLDDHCYDRLQKIIDDAGAGGFLNTYQVEAEKALCDSRKLPGHLLGINEDGLKMIDCVEGSCDWRQFQQGNYVLLGDNSMGDSALKPGDRVHLELSPGQSGDFEVLGIVNVPYGLKFRFGTGTFFDYSFYLPEAAYQELSGETNAMTAAFNVKDGTDEAVQAWLRATIDAVDKPLYIDSRLVIKENSRDYINKYYVVLGTLCIVMFIIGLLNYFNTSAVSILSRRRELSLLEAVGMTKKQLRKMLIAEGVGYLLAALILADTVGTLAVSAMVNAALGEIFFFTYRPTILPSLISCPLLLLIAFAVPVYHYKRMGKETLLERLREE